MSQTYYEKPRGAFLWARLILDTLWDELKNILSLGVWLRRQRELRIAPGEVLIVDSARREPSELAKHVSDIAMWWGLGSAKAMHSVDIGKIETAEKVLLSRESFDERKPKPEPGAFPQTWLLKCRHGHELSLARRLRRHAWRVARRTGFSQPLPFITAVPFIHLESTTGTAAMNFMVGPQVAERKQTWTPTLGIVDSDVDESKLQALPAPQRPQVTWHGTVIDQGQNKSLTVSTNDSDRIPDWHGTSVALIAASKARVDMHLVGMGDSRRQAAWLDDLSASLVIKALHTLRDCDVINLSLTVDQTESDTAVRFEDALSEMLQTMVDSGTIVVSAVGQSSPISVQQSSGDYRPGYIKTAGIPASLPHVIAVGTDDPNDRNEDVSGLHIIVHLDSQHHLCTFDNKAFCGSSAACAYVSGQICNYLGATSDPSRRRVERAREINRHGTHQIVPWINGHVAWTNEVIYINAT